MSDGGVPEPQTDGVGEPPANLGVCVWHADRRARVGCHGCNRAICAACTLTATVDDPPEPRSVCSVCAPLFGLPSSVPFEDPGGAGGFFRTWGRALAAPGRLTESFPRQGIARPTLFAYLVLLPWAALSSLCCAGFALMVAGFGARHSGGSDETLAIVLALSFVWGLFVLAPVAVAAATLLVHGVALIAGGEAGFVATYRLLCYLLAIRVTTAPVVLLLGGLLSGLGGIVGLAVLLLAELYHSWALFVGARRIHGLAIGGAVAVALTPVAFWCLVGGGLTLLTFGIALL